MSSRLWERRAGFLVSAQALARCDCYRRILCDQQHAQAGALVELDNLVEHLLDRDRRENERELLLAVGQRPAALFEALLLPREEFGLLFR